jgi:hypothetical protein
MPAKGMESLPDLAQLTPVQKDELIHTLWGLVGALRQEVIELKAEVADRRGRLAQTSRNSSKPPSLEGDAKPKPKSLRTPGKNPTGGQKGHAGPTLEQAEHPDPSVTHAPPATCDTCGLLLPEATVVEARQVFDLPPTQYEVTEHRGRGGPEVTKGRLRPVAPSIPQEGRVSGRGEGAGAIRSPPESRCGTVDPAPQAAGATHG